VNAWRAPRRILHAHPPDQPAQLRVNPRSPPQQAPTPVAAKAGPVLMHECLGPDDCEHLQDRRKPAIQLDQEPAIMVREPDATRQPTPHHIQLMSKHRVLSFKPQLRLEWRGQNETEPPDHSASLADSITASTRIRFSVRTGVNFPTSHARIPAKASFATPGEGRLPLLACAVQRRRFPVGASPTRQPLQPEAIGTVMEVTKWLKPSISVSRIGGSASVQAATRVNVEQEADPTAISGKAETAGRVEREYGQLLHRGIGGGMCTRKAYATREAPRRGQR
jgi:hypothetical protein